MLLSEHFLFALLKQQLKQKPKKNKNIIFKAKKNMLYEKKGELIRAPLRKKGAVYGQTWDNAQVSWNGGEGDISLYISESP